jgi:hypothetical protein
MDVYTNISYGYLPLLETFFKANDLDVTCEERIDEQPRRNHTTLHFEDNSDTAYSITFMSVRHLGFENMLCDYLIRCGVAPGRISVGKVEIKRDMEELDRKWEEHRKLIGLR